MIFAACCPEMQAEREVSRFLVGLHSPGVLCIESTSCFSVWLCSYMCSDGFCLPLF